MDIKKIIKFCTILNVFTLASVSANPLVWQFTEITQGGSFNDYSSPSIDGDSVAFSYNQAYSSSSFLDSATESEHREGVYIDVNGKFITVADYETPFPDNNDHSFYSFGAATIDQGNVAFNATAFDSVNYAGVFSYMDGILNTVADTNTEIPEGTGIFAFSDASGAPNVDIEGDTVVFRGEEGIDGLKGIYSKTGDGDLRVIADTNTSVPFSIDLPSDITGKFIDFSYSPSIDEGNIAFTANFVTSRGDNLLTGVYNVIDDKLVVVADVFTSLPQSPENSTPSLISPSFDQGDTAFLASSSWLYANINGTIEKIAESVALYPSIDNGNIAFQGGGLIIQTTIGGVISEVWDDNFLPKEELFPAGSGNYVDIRLGPDGLNGNSIAFVLETGFIDGSDGPYRGFTGIIRADLNGLSFPDFTDSDYLTLNGDAIEEESILVLTPDEPGKSGSAFFTSPLILSSDSSFRTHFSFKISGENSSGSQGSDGLAFVIHSDSRKAAAIGNSGEGLGFGLNKTVPGLVPRITPSMAIEFDTHKNSSFDSDGNHVALIINGDVSNHLAQASLPCSTTADSKCLNSGESRYAWIDYHGASKLLRVYMSETKVKPTKPIISKQIDLFSQIGEQAFFGFSASTGDGYNRHEILDWQISFDLEGDFNGDSCIDRKDLSEVIVAVRSGNSDNPQFDVNNDGSVNIADARKLVTMFTNVRGTSCSPK